MNFSVFLRTFTTSSFIQNKLSRVPYPWKNLKKDYPDYNYATEVLDDHVNEENKQLLLNFRIEETESMNNKRILTLKQNKWPRNEYVPLKTQRIGLIGIKLGMISHWSKNGSRKPLTLYQIMDNVALNYIPPTEVYNLFNRSRYYMKYKSDTPRWLEQQRWGLQFVGAVTGDPVLFKQEYSRLFTKFGVIPRHKLARFLISDDAVVQPGTDLDVQHFKIGDFIDITARTINHGFEGVMLKHKFGGGKATDTKFHRRPGNISNRDKLLRGKKMPGVMGNRLRTYRGIQIARIDYRLGILYLNGPTPGPINSYAHIYDTWLKYRIEERLVDPENKRKPSMPTIYDTDDDWIDWTVEGQEEAYVDWLHQFDEPSLTFSN